MFKNKIGNRTLHSIRHTHCSMLIHEGVSIYYISKRLGHTSINTTLSIYSHLLEETEKQEDEKNNRNFRTLLTLERVCISTILRHHSRHKSVIITKN